MAIQTVNLAVPNGDTPRSANTKINANFSDQTHAASRLVGTLDNQIPLAQDTFKVNYSKTAVAAFTASYNCNNFEVGTLHSVKADTTLNAPTAAGVTFWSVKTVVVEASTNPLQIARGLTGNAIQFRQKIGGNYSAWATILTSVNTSKDSNGFIKAASPIVKVFADKVELNDDAVNQNVTFKKNGIGDYTITTVSGLSTDGWYIELPKDMNGNPKIAVTLSEVDGVISLKSYKRIFSMETFTFEPDLGNPLDIPDTRWIDIRLNEIPIEMPDDIQTEV